MDTWQFVMIFCITFINLLLLEHINHSGSGQVGDLDIDGLIKSIG